MFAFLLQGACERMWEFVSGHRLPKVVGLFIIGYLIGKHRLYARLGEKGTSARDDYEAEMNSFLMGEAIRKARLSKHLTQEQLGDMIGVKRAQVSRIEKGHNLTFATMARVFRSMGIRATLDMGSVGKVALW